RRGGPERPARPGHHAGSSVDTADGLAAVARRAGRAQGRHGASAGRVRGHAQRVAARADRRGTAAEPPRPRFAVRADGARRDQLHPDRGLRRAGGRGRGPAAAAGAGPGGGRVEGTGGGSVAPGRYRLRQGDPVRAGTRPDLVEAQYAHAVPEFAHAAPQHAYAGPVSHVWQDPGPTVAAGLTTMMEPSVPPVPVLRLVTGSSVAETRTSGARAGRGPVELVLPDVPTVSREHARVPFAAARWWISSQGRNGLTLNGAAVTDEQPLSDGDEIRWGKNSDAPLSRVEIS